jgi:hypothetical protein
MADTNITLSPATAGTSGAQTVTASAALFAATDVGRLLSIKQEAPIRVAATAYAVGAVFYSEYNSVPRVYRVVKAGTSAAANMSGTTPNYDLNAPRDTGLTVTDGSVVIRFLGPGKQAYGWGTITAYLSTTQVTVDVAARGTFANTTTSLRWKLGEWSDARGWPRTVGFHQLRLWWGGTATKPQTLWASETDDFDSMAPHEPDGTVLDTNAITISLDDDEQNAIHWLRSQPRGLAIGTARGEYMLQPASTTNGALGPANVKATHAGARGSAQIPAIRAGGTLLFIQRDSRRVRQLDYDFGSDRFTTADMTNLADHITGPGIVEAAWQESPYGLLWLVRSDGVLISLSFDPEQKVRAWCRHILGGTNALVESVCVVPNPSGTADDVIVAVARTINGATVRTLEYMRAPFRADLDGATGHFFVDCGLTYSGTPARTFTGLSHLEGETVQVCADGAVRVPQIVTGGAITISGLAASIVHIGLGYRSEILTLPLMAPPGVRSVRGKLKRAVEITLSLSETRGGRVGRADSTDFLPLRSQEDAMDKPMALFSGDFRYAFNPGVDRAGQIQIIQEQPLPLTVLAIATDLKSDV